MYYLSDIEFLESYWEHRDFVWFEFENKKISMTEREELLKPYRERLHKLMKEGVINEQFRLVERT